MDKLICGDVSGEKSRQYNIYGCGEGLIHSVHISSPKKVFFGKNHTFHRIFDGKIVQLVPAPGFIFKNDRIIGFCEVNWEPQDKKNPVQF